jgi:hypothetical protein
MNDMAIRAPLGHLQSWPASPKPGVVNMASVETRKGTIAFKIARDLERFFGMDHIDFGNGLLGKCLIWGSSKPLLEVPFRFIQTVP